MKKLLLAAVFFALGACSAVAGDRVSPAYNWSGFYVGLNAGWIGAADNTIGNTEDPESLRSGFANLIPGSVNSQPAGFLGGGQIGYNWQIERFVIGGEADFEGANARSRQTVGPIAFSDFFPSTTQFGRTLDWLTTIRGRIGITVAPSLLVYGTGGLAAGRTTLDNSFSAQCLRCRLMTGNSATTSFGWTAGAGAEWMLAPRWSIKAEYLHVDLGTQTATILFSDSVPPSWLTSQVRNTENIVRAGINYRFGG